MIGNMDVSVRRATWMVTALLLGASGCKDGFGVRWPGARQTPEGPLPPAAPGTAAAAAEEPPLSDTLAEVEAFLARLNRLQTNTGGEAGGTARQAGADDVRAAASAPTTAAVPAAGAGTPAAFADAPAASNTSASIEDAVAPAVQALAAPVVRFVGVVAPAPTIRDGGQALTSGANLAAAAVADERSLTLEEYAQALRDGTLGLTELENAWRLMLLEMVMGAPSASSATSVPSMDRDVFAAFADLSRRLHDALADPLDRWDDALAASAAMHQAVAAAADLRIPTLVLCREVRSFGNYDAMPADQFLAGQSNRTIVYCEVENFQSRLNADGLYETTLTTRVELFDAVSGASIWSQEQPDIVDTCRRRRSDFFLAQRAVLPATLAEGRYVMKMTVEDTLAGRVSEQTLDLEIRSPASLAAGG